MLSRLFRSALALLLVLAIAASPASAQDSLRISDAATKLGAAATEIRQVDNALNGQVDEQERSALRERINTARAAAADAVTSLQSQLDQVDARAAQLGPAQASVPEAPDIRAQRRLLALQRSTLDSAIKRGKLLGIEAQQLIDEVDASQAEQLSAQISMRVRSPASPGFWGDLVKAFPRDANRTEHFVRAGLRGLDHGLRDGRPLTPLGGLVIALALLFPLRVMLQKAGRRYLIEGAPGHRVRRSGYSLWRLGVGTLLPGLASIAFVQGLRWGGMIAESWEPLASSFVFSSFVASFIAALGGALLMRGEASWRLLPISDLAAQSLRPWTRLLAALAFVIPLMDRFVAATSMSAAASSAAAMVEALLHVLLLGGVLVTLGRLRARRDAAAEEGAEPPGHPGLSSLSLAAWLIVIASVGALLLGYAGFALFIVRIVPWALVVAGTLYLLLVSTDDVATTLFCSTSRFGQAMHRGLGLRRSTIDQFGVLISGSLRVLLSLIAAGMLMAPFGSGVGSLFDRLGVLVQGVTIGEITISPAAILRAVVVFAIGNALVRLFQRWLTGRYLPTTELDGSARNSVALVARYVGLLLTALWTLASLGIGVERIALLLSALSVGIGFGLQAITQNFVSGLILLAERPVKIGDLIRIGADEGDVRRISVRSTEIELADHSTLIVPNSELITKTVLNKTLASPLGRIQLQFSVPLGADASRVRAIVLEVFAEEEEVLSDPEPAAFVDSIADGRINFNCFAHVSSPRTAYPARSAVMINLLGRLHAEGIDVGTLPQRLELAPGVLDHVARTTDRS
jgi:small-conductance mechanosensitive channel